VTEIEKYLQEKPPLVPATVCFLVKDGRVLLGLRKKVSLGLGENLIGGIGGKVGDKEGHQHETIEEGMQRELDEEVGVQALTFSNLGKILFLHPHQHLNRIVFRL